ncbi:hypothetical protein [Streptomyces sp. STR69]|uniref:hypothetical protein n=1 Tax=Streptomyces sp. STR69 TaxID=1796942 RepID=UPI0021CAB6F1|nr:hypothetical protein [Streptomyces sp. STR69]
MPEGLAQWGQELFLRRERERRRGLAPESVAGQGFVRRGFEPCLLALLRLSASGDVGTGLTGGWFPGALARTGHLVRAAELAYTISGELKQGEALLALVQAAAGAGDLSGAQALAESIPLRQLRDEAQVALVPAWALAGERDRAVTAAETIRYPHNWAWTWAVLAKAVADGGDTHEALRFAARAEDEARAFVFEGTGQVLVLLMEVVAATGDHVRAAVFADRVEDFSRSHNRTPSSRSRPLAAVLARETMTGDLDRVDALLCPPPRPPVGAGGEVCGWALTGSADQDAAPEGDLDEIDDARPLPPRSFLGAGDLAYVLDTVAETADQEVALALADRAEALLETGDGRDHDVLLRAVTLLLARHGQAERAMALATRIDPEPRVGRQAEIVGELARYGDTDAAEALARAITDRRAQARALIEVVRELSERGDAGAAETLAQGITDRWARGEALVAVVRECARGGDLGRAEAIAHSIAHRATRARALAALVEASVEVSEPAHARRLAAQAVVLDGWGAALPVLESIVPRAVAVVVEQMMMRDGV